MKRAANDTTTQFPVPSPTPKGPTRLSSSDIAGIVVGAAIGLVVIVVLIFFVVAQARAPPPPPPARPVPRQFGRSDSTVSSRDFKLVPNTNTQRETPKPKKTSKASSSSCSSSDVVPEPEPQQEETPPKEISGAPRRNKRRPKKASATAVQDA